MSKLGLSVLLTIVLTAALASTAPAAIRFAKIHYNSPGADTGTNASLNGEWFTIRNTGPAGRSLTGWKVRDKAGNAYTFGSFTLGARQTVRVHTGNGPTAGLHRYWGRANHVWGNTKDTARLRNAGGGLVDTCSYNAPSKSEKLC